MTNNDWIEEFEKEFIYHKGHYLDGLLKSGLSDIEVRSFISNLLTQKDQKHKAELERIKGEIEEFETYNDEPDNCRRLKVEAISILDSHINKLSTE